MTSEQISELAKAIVNEEVLINWQFYVLIILLGSIGGYIGNFINSYAKKRGENLATKADMNEIKSQLTSTTKITAKIKNDIEHQVWHKQQIETLKRNKLEEYLQFIYIVQEDLSKDMNNKYFNTNESIDVHAMNKATMLQKLYFPELENTHSKLLNIYNLFKLWITKGMEELIHKQQAGEQRPIISTSHMDKYSGLLAELNKNILLVEAKSEAISGELNMS